jgi:translation initiation factor 5B
LYDWQSNPKRDVKDVINSQPKNTIAEFDKRKQEVILQFAEQVNDLKKMCGIVSSHCIIDVLDAHVVVIQGLNAALCFENPDQKTYISMVPTSAFTGEGMGNLMALIVELSQSMLSKRLTYSKELQVSLHSKI